MGKLYDRYRGTKKFNYPLYSLREQRGISQRKASKQLGLKCVDTYMRIERGIGWGQMEFWREVQDKWNVPAEKMWYLITGDTDNFFA